MKTTTANTISTKQIIIFVVLAYLWSYVFWIPVAVLKLENSMSMALLLIGIAGPMVSAIYCLLTDKQGESIKSFFKRSIKVKASGKVYSLTLFCIPLILVETYVCLFFLTGFVPDITSINESLISGLIFFPIMLLTNLIPEELGWRGYLLDKLQIKMNPLSSSIILGVIWCFWHTPLFFISSVSLSQYGISQVLPHYIFLFLIQIIGLSIIMTYLYNASGRSTFNAILLHGVGNFTFGVFFGFLGFGTGDLSSASVDMLNRFNSAFTIFMILIVLVSLIFVMATNGRLGYNKDDITP